MNKENTPKTNRLFILDEETKFLYRDHSNSGLILSESELDEALSANKENLKTIVIIAELDWEGKHLQHFCGLELAKKIRVEYNCLCPIVICSGFSEDFILNTPIPALDFYKSPGTYYLHINDLHRKKTYLDGCKSIDEEILLDITESFGDQKGIISNVIHDLKNKRSALLAAKNNVDRIQSIIEEQFTRLFLIFRGSEKALKSLKNSFAAEIISGDVDKSIAHLEDKLLKLAPQDLTGGLVKYEAHWKIIFLDDEEDIRKYIKDEFGKRGLHCDVAADENELYELLKKDEKYNYYTVLICDYRLKVKGSEKLCHKQGYSILKEIFLNKPNYLSLFALSSMNSKVLLRLREQFNMKVWTFSKGDVQKEAGFNIFCASVFEEGEKMYETICSLPGDEYAAWVNPQPLPSSKAKEITRKEPFRNYYRAFKMAENFEEEEKKISRKAQKLYNNRKVLKQDLIREPIDLGSITPHPYVYTSKLKKGVADEGDMEKFKEKLIGRRVYLALRFKSKIYDLEKLAILLHSDPRQLNLEKGLETGYFSAHLCMPEDLEKMPILFPEEKHWLKYQIGFDLDEQNRQTYNEIWEIIREECPDGDNLPLEMDSLMDLQARLEEVQRKDYWGQVATKVRIIMQEKFIIQDRKEQWHEEEYANFRNRYAISGVMDLLNEFELIEKKSSFKKDKDKDDMHFDQEPSDDELVKLKRNPKEFNN